MEQGNKNSMTIPVAIIIAGAFIAGAIFYTSGKSDTTAIKPSAENSKKEEVVKIPPITAKDHVLGNPDAPVVLVEYSDTECPFCKTFHGTMEQVVEQYGKDGNVAWIYRHFPLDSLHSKARKETEAMECAAELGGNDKFWAYTDRIYEVTPSNNGLDLAELPKIAEYVGLNPAKFAECLKSGKQAEKVAKDLNDATDTGGRGTPWSIVIGPSGKKYPVNGAYPVDMMKQIIDQALAEK